jgi:hypothetical protein
MAFKGRDWGDHSKLCSWMGFKKDSVTRFSPSGFFHELVSPKPLEYDIATIICHRCRLPLVSTILPVAVAKSATGVVDTGGAP